MITRTVMVKAVAFVVISVGLILYILISFLGVLNFLRGDYTVTMRMPEAAGLFERGEVDYRGVAVGNVESIRLTPDGVEAVLLIEGDAPPIPADLRAFVLNRSAAGERFVDLRPNTDTGPFLSDGSVIPRERVVIPVEVEDVLVNLDQLVTTVPLDDLRTVVRELGTGFNNLGGSLQLLLDSSNALVNAARDNLPQTLTLIRDATTVLRTQNELSDPIRSFSRDLRLVTEQLERSDEDLRRLTETGPEAARQISALLDTSGEDLGDTIRELLTLSQIAEARNTEIRQVLIAYPMLTAAIPTILPGDGTAHLGLILNVSDPPPCTRGYQDTIIRDGEETGPVRTNFRAYCREPLFSEIGVRAVKPEYPFENGEPQDPPEWFEEFYDGGPQDGINGSDGSGYGDSAGYGAGDRAPAAPVPDLPGLLAAPDQQGMFGLTPFVLAG